MSGDQGVTLARSGEEEIFLQTLLESRRNSDRTNSTVSVVMFLVLRKTIMVCRSSRMSLGFIFLTY